MTFFKRVAAVATLTAALFTVSVAESSAQQYLSYWCAQSALRGGCDSWDNDIQFQERFTAWRFNRWVSYHRGSDWSVYFVVRFQDFMGRTKNMCAKAKRRDASYVADAIYDWTGSYCQAYPWRFVRYRATRRQPGVVNSA